MSGAQDADNLIKIYNEIDAFLRRQAGADRYADHSYLLQQVARTNRIIARYESELRSVGQLRNSLVHNPVSEAASPMAYPHPALVAWYKTVRDMLTKPTSALSIAVPGNKIYTASPTTNLHEVLQKMSDHTFTHVPIIKDDKMVGIFSENTLLTYLADNGEAIILKDMTMADFAGYLPLKSHKGEEFVFLPRTAGVGEVYDVFSEAIKVRHRIGMVFITQNGKESEKPLGIITAWDLASPEFELA